jgi:TrmH family RNA methyltransferase
MSYNLKRQATRIREPPIFSAAPCGRRMNRDEILSRILHLRTRAARDTSGSHYVEGIKPVLEALASRIPFETLVFSEILLQNPYARIVIRRIRRSGMPVVKVTPEQFRSVSTSARASGIGAIVRQHWTELALADPHRGLCWIALSRLRSPGNLGTIVRTAEAAGVAGLVLLGDAIDPFDPAVVRASMGGLFGLQLVRTTLDAFREWSFRRSCRVVGTSPSAPLPYTLGPTRPPLILLFGEERSGLAPPELALCTHRVRIPIFGRADSLNVGVAAGVVLYELLRRRAPDRS